MNNLAKQFQQPRPVIVSTAADADHEMLEIDCDHGRLLSITRLEDNGDTRTQRPISYWEWRELKACTLSYGRSPLLYRLWRLLTFSVARRINPGHTYPIIPLSNVGYVNTPEGSTRKRTR